MLVIVSILLTLVTITLIFISLLFITSFLSILFRGAPHVPTPRSIIKKAINLAKISKGQKVADLGSGDGRFLIAAAKADASSVGYEINPWLVWLTKWKIKKGGLKGKAQVRWGSFWKADLSNYDVVFIYGLTSIMDKLIHKLKEELKPGAKVITYVFPLVNWPAQQELKEDKIYLYQK